MDHTQKNVTKCKDNKKEEENETVSAATDEHEKLEPDVTVPGAVSAQSASNSNIRHNYEAYGARPKIKVAATNTRCKINEKTSSLVGTAAIDGKPSSSLASLVPESSKTTGIHEGSKSKETGNLHEVSRNCRSIEDDSSSQEETVETVEERMRQQSRPTCTTTKNSIIVHTNYFPKHMLPQNRSNPRHSGDMSVFDSPDDNMSNIVDFIETDIARVYLHGSNSSRGSSTGDLCDTTSNVSSLPHENISGLHQSDTDSDHREKDRPLSDGETGTHCDKTRYEHTEKHSNRNSSSDTQLQQQNMLVPNCSLPCSDSHETKPDVDYLDLDLGIEAQYSPEYLQSNSSESNFQYERSLSVELGYNTDSFSDGMGAIGGDSTLSGNKTDSDSTSDDFPFSDGYGTIKARDSSGEKKKPSCRSQVDNANNLGEQNGWVDEQNDDDLFNVSRQTSTSNFDQDENSFQDQDSDSNSRLVCMVDPVKNKCKNAAREKHAHRIHTPRNNPVNMNDDPILNAHRLLPNHHHSHANERHLFIPDVRHPRSLFVNRERRAASLEDSDILGSSHRNSEKKFRKDYGTSRRLDVAGCSSNVDRLDQNGAAHIPCYSLPLLPQELDSVRQGVNGDIHDSRSIYRHDPSLDLRDGLADLHLASQEQWDEYMALSRSLSSCRPRGNVSVVRPLSPTLPSTSNQTPHYGPGCCSKDDVSKSVDTCTDLLILHLMREREQKGKLQDERASSIKMDKVMIWSEYEAYLLQVKQIGTSACGPTAVINILKALNIYVDKDAVCGAIKTNLRAETAPLPQYLLSRSIAGTTAHDLLEGIQTLTHGKVNGRFFDFYPKRAVDIREWMAHWMRKGAVPLLTLNLQHAVPAGWQIPDAWHHQMAYGVSPKGVYLTNPLELVPCSVLNEQLCSDSVLLVRRQDILSRWNDQCDLSLLLEQKDPRWSHMNVIGQVVNVMREQHMPKATGYRPNRTSHVKIPAVYRSGISLFAKTDSDVYKELLQASELPLRKERFMETAV